MPEIEVFGGGIFGLSVAYACKKRGAKVRLIEKRQIGAGASGGLLGALAPHTPDNWNDKKQFQYENLIAARSFWPEVDTLSGISSGYGNTGRLTALMDARVLDLARARVKTAKEFWHGRADWRVIPCGRFPNWEPTSATGYLVHDTMSARIAPAAACRSLAQAFKAIGGEIVLGTDKGRGGDATVLATGYEGLADLSRELGRPVGKGIKGQGLLLAHDARTLPQVFADGMHLIAHADGTTAIGATSEIDWQGADRVDERLDDLYARAMGVFPWMAGARILRRWAGVRPRAKRRTPMLGAHPMRPGVFIANGGFKIGFGVAIRAGEVIADLVLDGIDNIPPSFSVEANLA